MSGGSDCRQNGLRVAAPFPAAAVGIFGTDPTLCTSILILGGSGWLCPPHHVVVYALGVSTSGSAFPLVDITQCSCSYPLFLFVSSRSH